MTGAEHWLLVPVGVLIAVVYTSTGISGANFWVPVYLLWLRLDAATAFWLALVTMLFGSLSGLLRHARQGTVDWRRGGSLLIAALPAAVLGAWLAPRLPAALLVAGFGLFALGYAGHLLVRGAGGGGQVSRSGDLLAAAAGGFGVGTVTVGLGALLLPRFLARRRRAEAAGTVLVIVFTASLVAALARLRPELVAELAGSQSRIFTLLAFVLPAVVVGGQLGPRLARRLEPVAMRRYAAIALAVAGALMLVRAWRF